MDINKELQEFNKRFGFVDDFNYEEEFVKFKTRVLNIFKHIDSDASVSGIALFCRILGIPEVWHTNYFNDRSYSENIIDALTLESNEKKFYRLLQIIFSFIPIELSRYTSRENYIYLISQAIDLSNINLSITVKEEEVIFYPKGESKLDKELVDEVLSFLNDKSQKHFIEALTSYLNFSNKNSIKSAESLRRSLEEFLRFKLQNHKGLKENIDDLQKKLKSDKCDAILRNIIFQIFSYLDIYFNENSKHNDGDIDNPENEFLIYQTGLLMRYLHRVIA